VSRQMPSLHRRSQQRSIRQLSACSSGDRIALRCLHTGIGSSSIIRCLHLSMTIIQRAHRFYSIDVLERALVFILVSDAHNRSL